MRIHAFLHTEARSRAPKKRSGTTKTSIFYDVKRRSPSPLRSGIKRMTLKVHFRTRGAKARPNVDRILAKKKQPRSTKKFEVSAFLRSEKEGTFAPLTRKDHSWSARRSKHRVLQRGNDFDFAPLTRNELSERGRSSNRNSSAKGTHAF